MKKLVRIALVVALLLIVGLVVVFLYLDRIVKRTVEVQATQSLALQTQLSGASLSLLGGKLKLSDLRIASPAGFQAPQMLTLGAADVGVSYGQLRGDPVHVSSITLDKPMLVIENQNGSINFKRAADLMPKGAPTDQPANAQPMKLIVDELTIKDAQVVVRPGIPGMPSEITVPVQTFTMRNVGTGDGSQNGAAVKDVVLQIISALAAHANSSAALPPELRALLTGDISLVMGKLGAEAQKQVMQALPGDLGKTVSGALADPAALTKDPGKVLGGLTGLGGAGAGAGNPATQPVDATNPGKLDPGKAAGNAVQGLLGGNKPKK